MATLFHENPELSNREFNTAKKIADHLKNLGLNVTTNVAHTGVIGVLEGDLPGKELRLELILMLYQLLKEMICLSKVLLKQRF